MNPPPTLLQHSQLWTVVGAALLLCLLSMNLVPPPEEESHARSQGFRWEKTRPQTLLTSLERDEQLLTIVLSGLPHLHQEADALQKEFSSGQRTLHNQTDAASVQQLLLTYLNYRAALLRLIWKYQNHDQIANPELRARAFLTAFTAAVAVYDSSLRFVTDLGENPEAVRKLNEPEEAWGIPAGVFDSIRRKVTLPENRELLREAEEKYRSMEIGFHELGLAEGEPHRQYHEAIRQGLADIAALEPSLGRETFKAALADVTSAPRNAFYQAQSFVSTWIGDTRIRAPRNGHALILPEQVNDLRRKLRPGDILIERRNWFLSNAFLPGYWPHSALYVGTAEDLKRLGLDEDPRVEKHWKFFNLRDEKGHVHVIIESISEGVTFTSLEHSVGEADSVAILRPRLDADETRECIARAFAHVGKPYDFEFDFLSSDKLVCTELVYRAYENRLKFDLVTVLGRKTMPALQIVRKFAQERGHPDPQLSFVAFLDGNESTGQATFESETALVSTLRRPALTWLQGLAEE